MGYGAYDCFDLVTMNNDDSFNIWNQPCTTPHGVVDSGALALQRQDLCGHHGDLVQRRRQIDCVPSCSPCRRFAWEATPDTDGSATIASYTKRTAATRVQARSYSIRSRMPPVLPTRAVAAGPRRASCTRMRWPDVCTQLPGSGRVRWTQRAAPRGSERRMDGW